MSNITEKAAYLKGLLKGLDIDESTKEGKLLVALVDIVDTMADSIADLEDVCDELDEVVDVLDEDLGELEKEFYSFQEDECGCGCGDDCDCEDYDDEDDFDDDDFDDEAQLFDVTCPSCGDTIYIDESMLEEGSIDCPNCSELLEFDLGEMSDEV